MICLHLYMICYNIWPEEWRCAWPVLQAEDSISPSRLELCLFFLVCSSCTLYRGCFSEWCRLYVHFVLFSRYKWNLIATGRFSVAAKLRPCRYNSDEGEWGSAIIYLHVYRLSRLPASLFTNFSIYMYIEIRYWQQLIYTLTLDFQLVLIGWLFLHSFVWLVACGILPIPFKEGIPNRLRVSAKMSVSSMTLLRDNYSMCLIATTYTFHFSNSSLRSTCITNISPQCGFWSITNVIIG